MYRLFIPCIRILTSERIPANCSPANRTFFSLHPLSYPEFIDLMRRSYLLLSDSGVSRRKRHRWASRCWCSAKRLSGPEAVEAGTAKLVGADEEAIVNGVNELLNNPEDYGRMSRLHNPYGDGYGEPAYRETLSDEYLGV